MFGNNEQPVPDYDIVWQPLDGSQVLAITAPCNHVLYEGTRGPGKTDTQLMRFRKRVGLGYGKFWRGIIFDRQYRNLEDLISKSQRWFNEFDDGATFSGAGGGGRWRWPTGEELLFRHIRKPGDYWLYHGHEYPFMGWNELSKYPTSELYDMMMSCNRSSFRPEDYPKADGTLLPSIPLEVFSTTNPFGPGHNWVKKKFIDVGLPGEVISTRINVFNPRTQEREDVIKTQVRIFGSYKENIYLSPEYIAELESIKDENKRRAWLWGDWDVTSGGVFDDLWDSNIHIVPRFKIPRGWYVDRSFDWGSSHPFWVGWWALANGETATLPDGRKWTPARNSLILINEWYGTKEVGTNKGLKMSAADIAKGILQKEGSLLEQKWVNGPIYPGPADNQIDNVTESETDNVAKLMSDNGVDWEKSDKSQGSRKVGIQLFRDRLEAALRGEGPAVYVMSHCDGFIGIVPHLPRDEDDPDDVDTDSEDHPWDGGRYRTLAGADRTAREVATVRTR